ncbi:MAG: hypothetical protein AAB777_00015, partial [Patescibacteria group bacterium]
MLDPPKDLLTDLEQLKCGDYVPLNVHMVNTYFRRSGGHFYWLGIDENKNSIALIEDDHVYREITRDRREFAITGFSPIGDEVAVSRYAIDSSGRVNTRKFELQFKDKIFSPYDEIKLCENSKDKLIFYAKKGDEHFVYVDGVENKLKLFEYLELKDIVVDGEGRVFLHFFNERAGNRVKHKLYSLNSAIKGNYDQDFSDVKDFSIINGKLSVFYSVSGEDYLMWDGTERKSIPLKTDKNNIIGFR